MAPRKTVVRNRLTISQKLEVCKHAKTVRIKSNVHVPNEKLAEWATSTFELPQPLSRKAVAHIVANEAKWSITPPAQLNRKKVLPLRHQNTDDCIMATFTEMDGVVDAITGDKRNGISLKWKHGEAASVDQDAVVDGRKKIRKITGPYARCDIYNMDETAFFFREETKTTLTQKKAVSGRKDPKNCRTLALAVNADGSDKLPPLYIGSAAVPRPLKGHDVWKELGVLYTHSPKAWMNTTMFQAWLGAVNNKMMQERRSILLLVDNVSSHAQPAVTLSNVRLEFLPKNTTSFLQPLDQGIIRASKSGYSKLKVMGSVDQ